LISDTRKIVVVRGNNYAPCTGYAGFLIWTYSIWFGNKDARLGSPFQSSCL
jgi:hypothetical protein